MIDKQKTIQVALKITESIINILKDELFEDTTVKSNEKEKINEQRNGEKGTD